MALANYTDLQAEVAAWLHRTDLTATIPTLITLAELRINGDLDARMQDTTTTLSATAGVESVTLPSDTINIRNLMVSTSPVRVMTFVTPDQFRAAYPFGQAGVPNYFSVVGGNILLAPTPDSDYTLSITYKAKIPALSDASPTNWLLTAYPQVYLFATLLKAASYMQADDRMELWEAKYREAIDSVNAQDWYSGSTMRVKTDTPIY